MAIPSSVLVHARDLRGRLTNAEQLLWHILRDRRFCGLKFRRQHPCGGYILDFYCHDVLMAIELGGGGHAEEDQKEYDDERTKVLEGAGIKVLRFWNHDVLNNLESVLVNLHHELFPSADSTPSPGLRPPSPKGRG